MIILTYEICFMMKVAKLQKRQLSIDSKSSPPHPTSPNPNKLHSIALNMNKKGSPSPQSAHAYTMTLLFNALEDGTLMNQATTYDYIQPAGPVEISSEETMRQKRIGSIQGVHGRNEKKKVGQTYGKASASSIQSVHASSMSSSSVSKKKKTTSAASFFGTAAKTATNKGNNVKKTSSIANLTNESKKQTSTSKSKSKSAKKDKTSSIKQDQPKHTESASNAGNADDFIGDEDEDEEFLEEEEERKKRNAVQEKKIVNKRATKSKVVISNHIEDMEVEDEDNRKENEGDVVMEQMKEEEFVTGAMDAFATKKKESNVDRPKSQKGRKRRKQVLEEKTYVDDNGFFRTETVTVWKEVDVDVEEEEEVQSNIDKEAPTHKSQNASTKSNNLKQKKTKNTKGMKQQGLMGFFAAKKK